MKHPTKGKFLPGIFVGALLLHLGAVCEIYRIVSHGIQNSATNCNVALFLISALGISVGNHRLFVHDAYKSHLVTRFLMALAGAFAVQGNLRTWWRNHAQHHAFTDIPGDPHSPKEGLWWAHMGWIFFDVLRPEGYKGPDCEGDSVAALEAKLNGFIVASGFLLPLYLGGIGGVSQAALRIVVLLHLTWCINSVCHWWGNIPRKANGQPYVRNEGRNNALIAILMPNGEGWHGNHHADPGCAYLGWKWYQWDPGKYLLWTLERWKLIWDVRKPRIPAKPTVS